MAPRAPTALLLLALALTGASAQLTNRGGGACELLAGRR